MTSEQVVVLSTTTFSPEPPSPLSERVFYSPSAPPDLRQVVWTDLQENEEGIAVGVFGTIWSDLNAKQLRTVASRLAIKGVKNVSFFMVKPTIDGSCGAKFWVFAGFLMVVCSSGAAAVGTNSVLLRSYLHLDNNAKKQQKLERPTFTTNRPNFGPPSIMTLSVRWYHLTPTEL